MNSLYLALFCFVGYIIAYFTYGKFLARKIFKIDPTAICPSETLQDGVDYVPTPKEVLFGHHFTSIAGLGPIVGPAIAVIWGWLPAMIWVFLGSIFMGAVHDFGSLVASMRHQGRSVGEIASKIVTPRVRTLFLLVIFFELWILIAVFALIIGILFNMYPQSVMPVWLEVPIALFLGLVIYRRKDGLHFWGGVALVLMYLTVIIGAYVPLKMPTIMGFNPIVLWAIIMLVYSFIASVLPVTTLLQPRDYINGHQLFVALILLLVAVAVAQPVIIAPMINNSPTGAPPVLPFLFVVVACGAISGFHAMVSSGTSAKQCASEKDAQMVGYGSMLVEASLSTLVIIAAVAGLGMGILDDGGNTLTGLAAYMDHYETWAEASGLGAKLSAFVIGSANMIEAIGIPKEIAMTIMGVFLVSFAATTLDSATRIQRYVVGELFTAWKMPKLASAYPATTIAVGTAALLAFHQGFDLEDVKAGALTLWPLFGTVNQLLAALALLVLSVYLARRGTKIIFTIIPMLFMTLMTGWAMVYNMQSYFTTNNWLLFFIITSVMVLELWMLVETFMVLRYVLNKNHRLRA